MIYRVAPDATDLHKITVQQALEWSEPLQVLYLQMQYLKVRIANGSDEYDQIEV
jgi:hypothetical protein